MEAHLIRFEDWPDRLAKFIEGAQKRPFSWGEFDCCLFAADWVREMTGTDAAAELRGVYASEDDALELVRAYGGMTAMVDFLLSPYNVAMVPRELARRGDVCLVDSVHGEALGVCCGERIACATYTGLVMAPMRLAHAAWRIG